MMINRCDLKFLLGNSSSVINAQRKHTCVSETNCVVSEIVYLSRALGNYFSYHFSLYSPLPREKPIKDIIFRRPSPAITHRIPDDEYSSRKILISPLLRSKFPTKGTNLTQKITGSQTNKSISSKLKPNP